MYCSQCGSKTALDAKFCGNCGSMTTQASPSGNLSSPTHNTGALGTVVGGKKNYVKWVLILAVVGVALFVLFNFFGGSSMPRGRFYPETGLTGANMNIFEFHGRGEATFILGLPVPVTYRISGNRLIITEETGGGAMVHEFELSRDRRSFFQRIPGMDAELRWTLRD